MDLYEIQIPDLFENPYIIKNHVLNNKTYYFEYTWNNRQDKAYLSIYYLENNIKTYILRGLCLKNWINISNHIYYENWIGELFFTSYNLDMIDYTPTTISTDFFLLYRIGELEVTE